jgi:endogenous inhibitor of DNA gyrase (YacG/DUF329 family)
MQVNMEERECKGCGETFVTSESDTSEYCSLVCRD